MTFHNLRRQWAFTTVLFLCFSSVAFADTIYVSNYGSGTVEKFSSAGADLGIFATLHGKLSCSATGLAFDSSGNLYVSDARNSVIEKFSSTGVDLGSLSIVGYTPTEPNGLAFNSAGTLYVACASVNLVVKVAANGSDFFGYQFAQQNLSDPFSLAFDSKGNLYVSNLYGKGVAEFSSAGNVLGFFKYTGHGTNGLAFDSSGNLFVSTGAYIEKYSSAGVDLGTFVSSGLSSASGMAFDSEGNLWVANTGYNTVDEFSSTGVELANISCPNPSFIAIEAPEPGSLSMICLCLAGLITCRKRK